MNNKNRLINFHLCSTIKTRVESHRKIHRNESIFDKQLIILLFKIEFCSLLIILIALFD